MDYLSLEEPTELRVSRAVDSRGTRENPPTIKYQESFFFKSVMLEYLTGYNCILIFVGSNSGCL